MDGLEPSLSFEPIGFVQSSHVFEFFKVKIGSLSGNLPQINYKDLLANSELFYSALLGGEKELCIHVQCQLLDSNGRELSIISHTPYKPFTCSKDFVWNSWLELPIRYCDLPSDTVVKFSILDIGDADESPNGRTLIGTASTKLFRKTGCLKSGAYDLKVSLLPQFTKHPMKGMLDELDNTDNSEIAQCDEDSDTITSYPCPVHVRKSLKKFGREELEKSNDFLDRFAFAEANKFIHLENKRNDSLYLHVQFSKFTHPQLKKLNIEIKYCELLENCCLINTQQGEINEVRGRVFDPDLDKPNLVEEKHKRLMIGGRKGHHADLKPDADAKNRLLNVLCKPLTEKLVEDERNLVWQYRYSLSAYPNALVKFLRSVEWDNSEERSEAVRLMQSVWAAPRIQDALELLSEEFASPLKLPCRQFAVKQLYNLSENDLRLFLLQIVQALRFEDTNAINRKKTLATITIGLGNTIIEVDTDQQSGEDEEGGFGFYAKQERERLEQAELESEKGNADLAEFLVLAAAKHLNVALDLNWYLEVEANDDKTEERVKNIFRSVKTYLDHYLRLLSSSKIYEADTEQEEQPSPQNSVNIAEVMDEQVKFVKLITERLRIAKQKGNDRVKRLEIFKDLLNQPVLSEVPGSIGGMTHEIFNFHCFPKPFPHPMDPLITVYGIDVEKITFFKSALEPAKLTFFTDLKSAIRNAMMRNINFTPPSVSDSFNPDKINLSKYLTIFKLGDDVRQDQLVVQTIALMDEILKRENLDLRLIPYKVMATNIMENNNTTSSGNSSASCPYVKCGFIEMVPSDSVQAVLKKHGKIKNWMKEVAPAAEGTVTTDGIDPEVMDTYVRSCAGYCVITYLLGVGDRHLENLLLSPKGNLFHIDFGFILDRDPKPFPPPMKLNKEMVEGMGGLDSEHYKEFKSFCFDAYQALRRSANLVLSLFNLMIHSSIPDICLEPDKTVKKVQDKFCLQMSDVEAAIQMQMVIDQSIRAVFPDLMDKFHEFVVDRRK